MDRIANFENVSIGRFAYDVEDCCGQYTYSITEVEKAYSDIKLPERATSGSAGYDFVCPFDIDLEPNKSAVIPTGIRCKMNEGWVLQIYPRSGLGFKYHMVLANTVGIIDADYYYAENEGHILVKIRNDGGRELHLKKGERFCQGIFVPFGITDFDNVTAKRSGGMGSTD